MRRIALFLILVTGSISFCGAQKMALKTNALYWATVTPNLSFEMSLSKKFSIDLTVGYNPFSFGTETRWKHYLIQPELRYWLRSPFGGHFFGVHTGFAEYNVSGIPLLYGDNSRDHKYEGWLTGIGISYGYQWNLSKHWNIEAEIGIGYVHTNYKRYGLKDPCKCSGKFTDDFVAPTKLGVSIVYLIN